MGKEQQQNNSEDVTRFWFVTVGTTPWAVLNRVNMNLKVLVHLQTRDISFNFQLSLLSISFMIAVPPLYVS